MPIEYARDDDRRLILATSHGVVTLADAIAVVDGQAADGAWSYGVLYDTRGGIGTPSVSDVNALVLHVGRLTTRYGPRGPVALVVTADLLGMGNRYARLGHLTSLQVEMFGSVEEAEAWLGGDSRGR
jgi:hypothetical protein